MPDNFLGKVRRSQILGYGPGAIIDFRAGTGGGAAVSVIAAGLEEWDKTAKLKSINDPHIIYETRLQSKLGKKYFRLPPVDDRNSDKDPRQRWLEGRRFPTWLQCPKCGTLKTASKWQKEIGDPTRWCAACSTKSERVNAVPTRFVIACENGHLDDFPWTWWLKRQSQIRCTQPCQLVLESEGKTGLSGLVLKCIKCNAKASMDGVFSAKALSGLSCHGRRPWLNSDEACPCDVRALQRGASNLYFPVSPSALSIPPWEDWLQTEIGIHWDELITASPETRKAIISPIARLHNKDVAKLLEELERRIEYINRPERADLKRDEYLQFIEAPDLPQQEDLPNQEFSISDQPITPLLRPFFSKIVKVDRLREVRAQTAFKRVYQPASTDDPGRGRFAELSTNHLDWLPAVEIRGEGIFLAFDLDALRDWEASCPEVAIRVARIGDVFQSEWEALGNSGPSPMTIDAKFLLIHTFAHALIRQLSLDCGYDAASLRERTYTGGDSPEMVGVLIYTGSSDSDGTLGGLARQAEPERIESAILGAIEQAKWCSADPLCLGGITSISETYNIAACHSCVLVPETSCEHFNRFLDRALIVGDPEAGLRGFFEELVGDR